MDRTTKIKKKHLLPSKLLDTYQVAYSGMLKTVRRRTASEYGLFWNLVALVLILLSLFVRGENIIQTSWPFIYSSLIEFHLDG